MSKNRYLVKHLLALFLILSCSFHGFSIETFRDLLNGKVIRYKEASVPSSLLYKNQPVYVTYIVVEGEQSASLDLLNANIKSKAEAMLTDRFVIGRFKLFFEETQQYKFSVGVKEDEHDEKDWQEFSKLRPFVKYVNTQMLSLCNDVVVVSYDIIYTTFEGQTDRPRDYHEGYSEIACFDLKTGKENNKQEIILPSLRSKFESLVREKIPKHLQHYISFSELENADLFFSGAGFYCLLQGNLYLNNEESLPCVHIRLSLEEIQPFLNPQGPYGVYLEHKVGTSGEKLLRDFFDGIYHIGQSALKYMEYDPAQQIAAAKVRKVTYHQISDTMNMRSGKNMEYFYDGKGNLMRWFHYNPGTPKSQLETSAVFGYHANGHLKSVEVSEIDEDEGDRFRSVWHFDERGNLVQQIQYDFYGEGRSLQHYTYIGDRVFSDLSEDYLENPAFVIGSEMYEFRRNEVTTTKMGQRELPEVEIKESNGVTELYADGKLVRSVKYEHGKPASIIYPGDPRRMRTVTIKRDQNGRPLRYEEIDQARKRPYVLEFKYNQKQLPVLISEPERKIRYEIRYE